MFPNPQPSQLPTPHRKKTSSPPASLRKSGLQVGTISTSWQTHLPLSLSLRRCLCFCELELIATHQLDTFVPQITHPHSLCRLGQPVDLTKLCPILKSALCSPPAAARPLSFPSQLTFKKICCHPILTTYGSSIHCNLPSASESTASQTNLRADAHYLLSSNLTDPSGKNRQLVHCGLGRRKGRVAACGQWLRTNAQPRGPESSGRAVQRPPWRQVEALARHVGPVHCVRHPSVAPHCHAYCRPPFLHWSSLQLLWACPCLSQLDCNLLGGRGTPFLSPLLNSAQHHTLCRESGNPDL